MVRRFATVTLDLQSCRPLSGAVSATPHQTGRHSNAPFNRAAPFRERLAGVCCDCSRCCAAFNRAAPFRERLGGAPTPSCADHYALQSCRPLSGAVRPCAPNGSGLTKSPFNRAAPFRERLDCMAVTVASATGAFNRAAPFRERLDYPVDLRRRWLKILQSCRPLSGAVSTEGRVKPDGSPYSLQSCRPLSGAVRSPRGQHIGQAQLPSIVPPPFGSG